MPALPTALQIVYFAIGIVAYSVLAYILIHRKTLRWKLTNFIYKLSFARRCLKSDRYVIISVDSIKQDKDDPNKFYPDVMAYRYNLTGPLLFGAIESAKQALYVQETGGQDQINDLLKDTGIKPEDN